MAGDWIKWCKGLARRREVILLAARFGCDRREIAGRLMEMWEWTDENFRDEDVDDEGNVSLFLGDNCLSFLDSILGLPGLSEAIASPEVCWLSVRSGGRVVFHNLARHNGSSAKQRLYEAEKKRGQRQAKKSKDACPGKAGTNVPPNQGPEKRREDIKEEIGAPRWGPFELKKFGEKLIARWNQLPGVRKHNFPTLADSLERELDRRLLDEHWDYEAAFLKFPLRVTTGWMPDIEWFLKDTSVRKILDGNYEQKFGAGTGRANTRKSQGGDGAGKVHDPTASKAADNDVFGKF